VCDLAESCDGASDDCPADAKSSTVCRSAAGVCDVAETCDGAGDDCPTDSVAGAFVTCRSAAGVCDSAENCDGVGVDCPTDVKSTTVCRSAAGVCDAAETCDGVGDDCPADGRARRSAAAPPASVTWRDLRRRDERLPGGREEQRGLP
jgi:hypothetical protein